MPQTFLLHGHAASEILKIGYRKTAAQKVRSLMRELYYSICLNMPENTRRFLNRIIPGLILEPIRVKASASSKRSTY